MLIKENLRERCIYQTIGEMNDEQDDHLFFNYLYNVSFQCLQRHMKVTDMCAGRVMEELGIEHDVIEQCIENSFVQPGDWRSFNMLLQEDREHANDLGI